MPLRMMEMNETYQTMVDNNLKDIFYFESTFDSTIYLTVWHVW